MYMPHSSLLEVDLQFVTNFDSKVGLGGLRHYKFTSSQKEKGLVFFEITILLCFLLN